MTVLAESKSTIRKLEPEPFLREAQKRFGTPVSCNLLEWTPVRRPPGTAREEKED